MHMLDLQRCEFTAHKPSSTVVQYTQLHVHNNNLRRKHDTAAAVRRSSFSTFSCSGLRGTMPGSRKAESHRFTTVIAINAAPMDYRHIKRER
jgi:prenyltransferase beta subunit